MDINSIAFFVVQNSEGKFFRRKGYGGHGDTWVDGLATARVWTKISGARSIVTFFANHYLNYPPPKIVKLTVAATEIIDETERIAAARAKKQKKLERREIWLAEQNLKKAKEEFNRAKEKYEQEQKRANRGNEA